MKVVRPEGIGTPLYVLPDSGRTPLAGPFMTAVAARLWIVEHIESGLAPAKAEVWRQVAARLPAPTDIGLELGLIAMVARGMTLEQLQRYIPRHFERRDPRALASGEAA